jgi:gamma-glutamylputrescine oxidase
MNGHSEASGLYTGLASEDELTRRSLYSHSAPVLDKFPVLSGNKVADVCVVGGGLAGISTALELRAKGFSVILLEGQRVGWGASGRNGGQVIVGHASEDGILAQLSLGDARRAWELSAEGVELVRQRVEKYSIDCDYIPGWMLLAVNRRKAKLLREDLDFVRDQFGYQHWSWIST